MNFRYEMSLEASCNKCKELNVGRALDAAIEISA